MRSQWIEFGGDPFGHPPSRLLIVKIWDEATPATVETWARAVLPLGAHSVMVGDRVDWEEIVRIGKEQGILVPATEEGA